MQCKQCKTEIDDHANFCYQCGASQLLEAQNDNEGKTKKNFFNKGCLYNTVLFIMTFILSVSVIYLLLFNGKNYHQSRGGWLDLSSLAIIVFIFIIVIFFLGIMMLISLGNLIYLSINKKEWSRKPYLILFLFSFSLLFTGSCIYFVSNY